MAETIGRYEIVGELGRGAMGIVYKAVDPTIGRTVALKTLRLDTQGVATADLLRRFKHEARLAGAMNHPNIVTIYDAGDHGDIFYIAMEFLEGVTLQSILHEQGRLPMQRMVEMSRHICSALDYANQRGVIHRDIKPANIMTTPLGNVKIMDFGIAKSEAGITSAGQILGTPAYMSPEQVQGKELDGRSDLFSFGVMLYEMVTGEMPFTGKNVTTIVYKIVHEAPIPPRQLDSTIHPALSDIITKALAKSPDERYSTGAALVHDLETYKSVAVDPNATRVIGGSMPTRVVQSASESPTIGMTAHMQSQGAAAATRKLPAPTVKAPTPPKAVSARRVPVKPQKKKSRFTMIAVGLVFVALLVIARAAHLKLPQFARSDSAAVVSPPAIVPAKSDSASETPIVPTKSEAATKEAAAVPEKPKPVVPAPPRLGGLQITSNPPGARVSISGKTQDDWITPFQAKKLAPGNYQLTFDLPNYETETMNVKVVAGQSLSMGADLTPSGGTLAVNSDPPGANIFIDNKPTGKQTPSQISVDAGEHKILIQKAGFFPENTAVTLKPGETYTFDPSMQAQKGNFGAKNQQGGGQNSGFGAGGGGNGFANYGMVVVRTNPPGATIQVNGRTLPKTTPTRLPVPVGSYHMQITLDGYRPIQRDFTIEANKPTQVQANLIPK